MRCYEKGRTREGERNLRDFRNFAEVLENFWHFRDFPIGERNEKYERKAKTYSDSIF